MLCMTYPIAYIFKADIYCPDHIVEQIDGVIHDTHDCSRGGTRCVYGFHRLTDPLASDRLVRT
jgi:hypothetical protein